MDANMTHEMRRRKTDSENAAVEIADLIKAEESPKDRAILLVLQTMNNSLISSNELLVATNKSVHEVDGSLNEHIVAFDEHVVAEGKIFAEGKGMYRILMWLVGAIQFVSIAVGGAVWAEVKGSSDLLNKHETRIQLAESYIAQRIESDKAELTALRKARTEATK